MSRVKTRIGECRKAFWRILRGYRLREDTSQKVLAGILERDQGYISRREKYGGPTPSRDQILRVAEELHLSFVEREILLALAGYFFGGELFEAFMTFVRRDRNRKRYGVFTHAELIKTLERYLAAIKLYESAAAAN